MARKLVHLGLLALVAVACTAPRSNRLVNSRRATSDSAARMASRPPAAPLPSAEWVQTTLSAPFARSTVAATLAGATADLTVDVAQTAQVIDGFGGAFNEQGWEALSLLGKVEQSAVLRALFDGANGLGFDLCRTPIGASDYAVNRYTLDEWPDDYEMAQFSIERDEERLIPYLRAALAVRPSLKLWGSAWTPPSWMKTNRAFDGGAMRDEPRLYAAYALYLLKYVEAYRALGIDVSMVVPQNEPGQLTHYPSADWKPNQYVAFIRDHLGPLLKVRSPSTRIFVGTINHEDWDVTSVLGSPGVAPFISGVALQWRALSLLPKVRAAFPELAVMQSETECGNHPWEPGFNPDRPPNDFAYAVHTWRKFRNFIGGGASSYMLWNMVLDERGHNIDTQRPWPQNAAIVINRSTRQVTYTPMYWVAKHFSALIQRGARLVATRGAFADRIAFLNPDGSVVVELMNGSEQPLRLTLLVRARTHTLALPPRSFASLIVAKE